MSAYVPLNTTWSSVQVLCAAPGTGTDVNPLFANFGATLADRDLFPDNDRMLAAVPKAWIQDIFDRASGGIVERRNLQDEIDALPDTTWSYQLALLTEDVTLSSSDDQILSYEVVTSGYARQNVTWTRSAPSSGQEVSYRCQPDADVVFGPLLLPDGTQINIGAICCVLDSGSDTFAPIVMGMWMLPQVMSAQAGESISILADSIQIGAQ
ncbi:hypothetical protein [Streptomyces sp. NBC_00470]|uniref:hypothetical protein n=1 Tax=Streptomyces sp. NBC_00470 TaxID=2975753 RepID=UPI0030E0003F